MSICWKGKRWARFFGLVLVWACVSPLAQADEYRRFVLDDGRQYQGKVLASSGLELTIEVPQGRALIDLTHVIDMQPVRQLDYDNQGDWRILLAPVTAAAPLQNEAGRLETVIEELLDGFSGLSAFFGAELSGRISADARSQLDACTFDVSCIRPAASESAVQYAIAARLDVGGSSDVRTLSMFRVTVADDSGAEPAIILASWRGAVESNAARAAILQALYVTLGLLPDTGRIAALQAPVVPTTTPPEPAPTPELAPTPETTAPVAEADEPPVPPAVDEPLVAPVIAGPTPPQAALERAPLTTYVPIPGFPALLTGDFTGVLLSWGVVVPATAVWVLWEGAASFDRADHAAMGLFGYYVATTAVNLTVGSGNKAPTVGVAPTDDGWVAGVTWRR